MADFTQQGSAPTQFVNFGGTQVEQPDQSTPIDTLIAQNPVAAPTASDSNQCDVPDSIKYEIFKVNVGFGSQADVFVQLKNAYRKIIFLGHDGGGGGSQFFSFQPTGLKTITDGGNPVTSFQLIGAGAMGLAGITGNPPRIFGLAWCKPISRFYISTTDTGIPGENLVFMATDDLDCETVL